MGIRISKDKESRLLYLDKEKYMKNVFKRFDMDNCKSLSMLVCKGQNLSKKMCPQDKVEIGEMRNVPYAQVVGSLLYVMTSTRHDICLTVKLVSRYQSNSRIIHWQAVKQIFRYLQGTKNI